MEGVGDKRKSMVDSSPNWGHLPTLNHPNYKLWQNYALFAPERGRLVAQILQGFMDIDGARILDVGCGVGGASLALAQCGANMLAIDTDATKVAALHRNAHEQKLAVQVMNTPVERLNAANNSFHVAVLQDVLEHLTDPALVVQRLSKQLKTSGLLFISTPNRWSPLNMFSDPHWNLPFVGMLSRKGVRFVVKTLLRREKTNRIDMAALCSFSQLYRLLTKNGFNIEFVNRLVAKKMLQEPRSVLNCQWHLRVVASIKRRGLEKYILRIVNDGLGLFNRAINPTWFLVARKL
jgi:2-polyprenyl-3-methyl-5-hydroxy-6-metoxy-1,4-benzoquinol methylase